MKTEFEMTRTAYVPPFCIEQVLLKSNLLLALSEESNATTDDLISGGNFVW